jgi:hypothetical protein
VSFDETLLRHPQDVGYLAPGDVLFPGARDELVPASGQGGLLVGQGAEFVAYVHMSSVTQLTSSGKDAKLSYMSKRTKANGGDTSGRAKTGRHPFSITRDGTRTVTDRKTGTVLGTLSGSDGRWDYSSDLVPASRPSGYETITDAAYALRRAWTKLSW